MSSSNKGRRTAAPLVLAIAAALGVGWIVGAHGGDTTLIHACVGKVTGNVRIVGATMGCTILENSVHWSISGTAGPQGPQGVPGLQGPQGSQGPQGLQGNVGPVGPEGPEGPTGAEGPQGASGVVDRDDVRFWPGFSGSVPPGASELEFVHCPEGTMAISGGYSASLDVHPVMSMPTTDGSWQFVFQNDAGAPRSVSLYALCMPVS